MRKIIMAEQVVSFLRTLPPDAKHALRLAISGLADGDRGTKALGINLEGYRRVAVGKYRVLYLSRHDCVECVHAGMRKEIYKEFKAG